MIALFDIGNTHTHIGLANSTRVCGHLDLPTKGWGTGAAQWTAAKFLNRQTLTGAALCSVVPAVTSHVVEFARTKLGVPRLQLTAETVRGVGVDYPAPK